MGAVDLPVTLQQVLSVTGAYAVDEKHREKVCLLSDGVLLIANSYKTDHAVLAYKELLFRNRVAFKEHIVSVEEIRKRYQGEAAKADRKGDSYRQREVVGLIEEGVALGASDIHFRNDPDSTKIYMRIDGFLHKVHSLSVHDGREICATMYGSMTDVADTTYKPHIAQDGRLKEEFVKQCGLYGVRIATRPQVSGNVLVARLLPNHGPRSLDELGYDTVRQVPIIQRLTKRTDGINIFSGPTGSGKSTSLHSLLSMLLKHYDNAIHLLTIEDPVEYPLAGAVQTPVYYPKDDPEAEGRAWAAAIKGGMRLDPDTIMVGEMRDRESAKTAFRASMTGHGVWSTLHANHALQAIDRLIDMGVEASFVTDATLVTGLFNQSLVAVNCPECRRPYSRSRADVEPGLRKRVERLCDPSTVFLRGRDKGCRTCGGKGYKGRTVVAEVCLTNQHIMNAYLAGGAARARACWVKDFEGMTKNRHLIDKVNLGLVDPEIGELQVCQLDYDELTIA